jgi:hypothetical protein
MNIRHLATAFTALLLAFTAVTADAHGWRGGHHGHGHRHWGLGVGIGFGFAPVYPWVPGYLVVQPAPDGVAVAAPEPAPRSPDPVIRPRSGQSAAQTEADRQECNRWATTQPSAMADAAVFHSSVLACMERRGYTVQ